MASQEPSLSRENRDCEAVLSLNAKGQKSADELALAFESLWCQKEKILSRENKEATLPQRRIVANREASESTKARAAWTNRTKVGGVPEQVIACDGCTPSLSADLISRLKCLEDRLVNMLNESSEVRDSDCDADGRDSSCSWSPPLSCGPSWDLSSISSPSNFEGDCGDGGLDPLALLMNDDFYQISPSLSGGSTESREIGLDDDGIPDLLEMTKTTTSDEYDEFLVDLLDEPMSLKEEKDGRVNGGTHHMLNFRPSEGGPSALPRP